jgi:ketosteroid isomerase-like protein
LELSDEKDAIHQVVSGYFDAFARDPAAAATFYGEPTLFVLPSEVLALATRSDVEAFLAKLLESLKSLGYSRTKLDVPRVKMLSSTTALYSTVAIRLKTDGTELQRAGFTYLLHKGGAGWKINEVIATDVDKLISAD